MNIDLKRAIVNFLCDNHKEFQSNNMVVAKFRPYIYDGEGQYLFGGKEVADFIVAAAKLITTV
tara:strand:+ start:3078 stop:3266 length:189 start_codon:yes stop_codon:yes gene_type:complete